MESELYKEIFGEGEAKSEAKSILTVLATRGISVSEAIRERILGCTDIPTLDVWTQRAVVVPTAAAAVRAKTPPRVRATRPAARANKT
jgi:hypothetical protein